MREQTAIKLFSIAAVMLMMCTVGIVVSQTEESDAASVYTITFNAPNGDGTTYREYQFESGTTIQLPVTTFSRSGFMIEYWEDKDGTRFRPGEDWTITRDDDLTAIYKSTNGEHRSSLDVDLEPGAGYQISFNDIQSATPGGGTITMETYTSPVHTQVIDGDNHIVVDAGTPPGIYYVEWSKAILGISPTHHWCQIRIASSFDTDPLVSSISIDGETKVNVGQTLTYTADVLPSNAANKAVTWKIASGSASITSQDDDSCTVRFSTKGTVVLEASSDDDSAATASLTINVVQPVTSLSISGSSTLYKEVGDTGTLRVTISPSTASDKTVSWSSSRTGVVSISGSGTSITYSCDSVGESTITVTANDGSGKSDSVRIVVEEPPVLVESVTISGGSSSMQVGEDMRLNVSVSPSDADDTSIYWYATPSNLVDFTYEGDTYCTFEALGAGTVTIYAEANDDSGERDSHTVTITEPPKSFTLSYNMDGGNPQLSSQNGTGTGDTYRFTIPATVPTKSGYDFTGWKSSDGTIYQPGQDFYAVPGTNTLTAQWDLIEYTCYINFVATGATSGVPPNDQYTSSSTSNHQFTIPNTTPVRDGYTFTHWLGSDGQTYYPGGSVSVTYNGTVTLTAQWDENILEISGTPSTTGLAVGTSWSFTPTVNVDGYTLSISGADWLIVNGDTISGTPTEQGHYQVTITVQKDNYASDSMFVSLNVVPQLSWTNAPTGGAIIYGI